MKRTASLNVIVSFFIILLAVSVSFAQNSKESKEILKVLKVKIVEDGEKDAIINPAFFRIRGNWAYLEGLPKKNATVEEYNYNVKALLKKSDGKWNVIKYLVGSNDFASMDWWKEFKAPKAIFP
ncbi:MAG TPA: hypothetical protein PKY82_29540 [Pyrinomonadaceae bacterium]|nr:hypothetical protein [Pyrinomonadaceae bacterium]